MSENKNEKEPLLRIEGLHAAVEGTEILRGVDLTVPRGQLHALMGPNGSGKSTLANVLMGHPDYEITAGRVSFQGRDVTEASPDERARAGLFLAFQYPAEIPGVSLLNFLRTALNAVRGQEIPVKQFRQLLKQKLKLLDMKPDFTRRNVNEGFSGGEKKRNEVLQLALLEPALAILDETDSGLDIDALRIVAEAANKMRGPDIGFLVITHYMRILSHLAPDRVHILMEGRIVRSGGPELADRLEQEGYDRLRRETAAAGAA
jgi:Fe-S cluster assembly ATP-binding protein